MQMYDRLFFAVTTSHCKRVISKVCISSMSGCRSRVGTHLFLFVWKVDVHWMHPGAIWLSVFISPLSRHTPVFPRAESYCQTGSPLWKQHAGKPLLSFTFCFLLSGCLTPSQTLTKPSWIIAIKKIKKTVPPLTLQCAVLPFPRGHSVFSVKPWMSQKTVHGRKWAEHVFFFMSLCRQNIWLTVTILTHNFIPTAKLNAVPVETQQTRPQNENVFSGLSI